MKQHLLQLLQIALLIFIFCLGPVGWIILTLLAISSVYEAIGLEEEEP